MVFLRSLGMKYSNFHWAVSPVLRLLRLKFLLLEPWFLQCHIYRFLVGLQQRSAKTQIHAGVRKPQPPESRHVHFQRWNSSGHSCTFVEDRLSRPRSDICLCCSIFQISIWPPLNRNEHQRKNRFFYHRNSSVKSTLLGTRNLLDLPATMSVVDRHTQTQTTLWKPEEIIAQLSNDWSANWQQKHQVCRPRRAQKNYRRHRSTST